MKDLEGKVVLVTGGNKGVGKGIALEFAKQGANVAIGYNSNPKMAEETLSQLNKLSNCIAVHADISQPESCQSLVDATIKEYNRLDVLVNNAALQTHYSLLESNLSVYQDIINVNLRGYFLMAKYSHQYLKQSEHGRVILISSVHGKRPLTYDAAYSVSKSAIEMFMREAALEFAPDKITVNTIAPAGVRIEGKTGNPRPMSFKRMEGIRQPFKYPIGRIGMPEDVGNVACFLASNEAEFITGITIRLDGGAMLI